VKILIIGGTVFLGRAIVNEAQKKGHQITLFNRGLSNPGIFHELEIIHGDRKFNLSALDNRQWDVVIDTCGYIPRIVRLSAEKLKSQVGSYIFISTLSVYADTHIIGINEDHPVRHLDDEDNEEINNETYGQLKAACEREILDIYQENALIIRPGLIVGPHDPTDRFTYWVVNVSHSQVEMPLWVPETQKENLGFFAFNSNKAIQNGLTFRDISETVYDTCTWAETRPSDHIWCSGINRNRQAELLKKWIEYSKG